MTHRTPSDFLAENVYGDLSAALPARPATSNRPANTENTENTTTVSHLNGLIKQKRNAQLKSLLLKQLPLTLINKRESSLLHTAVAYNNIDAITLLFTLEFNINARNRLGETPLLLAARQSLYKATQLLLTLGADVFAKDVNGENAVRVLLKRERNTPTHVIASLFEILKKCKLGAEGIVDILIESNCPLEHVLLFDNAGVTMVALHRAKSIDEDTSCALLHSAILSRNMENVFVLLHFGKNLHARRKKFVEKVTKNILDPATRPFFEEFVNYDLVTIEFVDKVERIFQKGEENVIESLLNMGIVEYSRDKYNRNLIINLFDNKKIDITKLLRNRRFDVNSVDASGFTALCRAIIKGNKAGIAYLLENGADPNLKDRYGQTPLWLCSTDEIQKLLLDAGADILVPDNAGRAIVDRNPSELVKAHYCILEAKKSMNDDNPLPQNDVLAPYREDLQWMKNCRITESISLFSMLVDKVEKTTRYVKNKDNVTAVSKAIKERELKPIYMSKLKKNLKEATEMHKLQLKAAAFLSEMMKILPTDHLVIEKIISFLTYQDLMVFKKK